MLTTALAEILFFLLAIGYLAAAAAAASQLSKWGAARFLPLAAISAYFAPPIINSCFRSFSSRHAIALYLLTLFLLLLTTLKAWRGDHILERVPRAGSMLCFIFIAGSLIYDTR